MIVALSSLLACGATPSDAPPVPRAGTRDDPTLDSSAELLAVGISHDRRRWKGYVDAGGAWVLGPEFTTLPDHPSASVVFARRLDGAVAIDRRGSDIVLRSLGDQDLVDIDRGVAVACEGDHWALIGIDGVRLAGPYMGSCHAVQFSAEGLAGACTSEGCGYVGLDGTMVVGAIWAATSSFGGGLGWVKARDGKQGFVDANGSVAIAPVWDLALDFDEAYTWAGMQVAGGVTDVEPRYLWSVIDRTGAIVAVAPDGLTPHKVGDARFHDGIAAAQSPDGAGHVTPALAWIDGPTPFGRRHDIPGPSRERRAAVWRDQRLGFVDPDGNLAIPCAFEATYDDGRSIVFSEGRAAVQDPNTGAWGYIDSAGNWAIAPKYSRAGAFERGWARVNRAGTPESIWIDSNGREVVPR